MYTHNNKHRDTFSKSRLCEPMFVKPCMHTHYVTNASSPLTITDLYQNHSPTKQAAYIYTSCLLYIMCQASSAPARSIKFAMYNTLA